jgi:ABC-type methionine transport system ATPase subunit
MITSTEIRQIEARIRMRIPREYQQEPVISHLVSQFGLKVNINAAILGLNGNTDGWFELRVTGSQNTIDSAINYLNNLGIEIWTGKDFSDY